MNNDLDIYTNFSRLKILQELFYDFNIKIKKISDIDKQINSNNFGLVLDTNDKSKLSFSLIKKSTNKIFIIQKNNLEKYNKLNNVIEATVNIKKLRSKLSNLVSNQKFQYKDLKIVDNKIVNTNNDHEALITEIEKQILIKLLNNKSCARKIFREEVLNIKDSIETNSLDSHLTRIRKKLRIVNSSVSIVSKNELVFIQ